MEESYHSLVFKTAIFCTPPKPRKRNRSLSRSYRLIALLSVLGKIHEEIVAKRLPNITQKNRLTNSLHFGGILEQYTMDAAATLTHDVEKMFGNNEILTVLTFNIERAFDRVSKTCLVPRLLGQKILLPVIRYVSSFLRDRKAAV